RATESRDAVPIPPPPLNLPAGRDVRVGAARRKGHCTEERGPDPDIPPHIRRRQAPLQRVTRTFQAPRKSTRHDGRHGGQLPAARYLLRRRAGEAGRPTGSQSPCPTTAKSGTRVSSTG